jgi:membrane-associated protein
VTGWFLALHGWWVYAAAGGLAFAEAALFVGLVVPGETGLVLSGVLAARGGVSLPVLLVVAVLAAVAGDTVGYLVGRRIGPGLRTSRAGLRVGPARWERADAFVVRRGVWAVVLGRWVGVLRALVPTVAGITRMPYRRFLAANVAGGVTWATAAVMLGYLSGGPTPWSHGVLVAWSVLGTAVVVVPVVVALVRRGRAVRRPPAQPEDDRGAEQMVRSTAGSAP